MKNELRLSAESFRVAVSLEDTDVEGLWSAEVYDEDGVARGFFNAWPCDRVKVLTALLAAAVGATFDPSPRLRVVQNGTTKDGAA